MLTDESNTNTNIKLLLKEIKRLNCNLNKSSILTYSAIEFANAIKVKEQTLRCYMTRANKGERLYDKYLPNGVAWSGKKYWTQEQVEKFWGLCNK